MPPSDPIRLDEKHSFVWMSGTASDAGANTIIAGAAGSQSIV